MTMKGKVAVVTGGGTGIGKKVAELFLRAGMKVVLNGRRESVLRAAAKDLDPTLESIRIVAGDIGTRKAVEDTIKTAKEGFGGVDVLINNAGIFKPTSFLDHTEKDFDAYLTTILKGTFLLSQAVVPSMRARGGGAIVNVGSMWGLQAVAATPSSAYSAAKAGVHMLTKSLALELAKEKIRVNAVAPAVVETPVYETFLTPEQLSQVLPSFNAFHPLGRNGQPADVAEAIAFLAGDAAAWITGAVLSVDGGVMAGRS